MSIGGLLLNDRVGKRRTLQEKSPTAMAEARANPPLGFGYEEEFVNKVDEDLNCPVCKLPLKNPSLTKCGHRFCFQCLRETIERQIEARQMPHCPVDRINLNPETDVFPDKATERKILSLIIKCASEGCDWTGELRSKQEHMLSCPKVTISCPYAQLGCTVKVQRGEVESHLESTIKRHLDFACMKLAALESKRDQVYIWKITNFNEVVRKAKTGERALIKSFPFYLGGDYGYRFLLYMYPNGVDEGLNTHLLLGVTLLKGEYDALLSWPLEAKIKFRLIDQQENSEERKDIVHVINLRIEGGFARPTQDGPKSTIAKYISLDVVKARSFIEDDTLFVQFQLTG